MNGSVVVVGQVPAPVPSRSGNVFVECNTQDENTGLPTVDRLSACARGKVKPGERESEQVSEMTVAKQEIQVSARCQ